MAAWRRQIQASRVKFDDEQKNVFLKHLAKHGRKGDAARAAGVALQTVQRHSQDDPDFENAYQDATDAYRDRVVKVAQMLSLEGIEKPILGGQFKDEVVAVEKIYATNILAMEMRRVDPSYRDKEVPVAGQLRQGVLVAPAEASSAEEWAARFSPKTEEAPGAS